MKKGEKLLEQNKHYDNLQAVATFYGFQMQLAKTLEELGELSTALAKTLLNHKNLGALKGEIADVYNMLDQLCFLIDCEEDVQKIAEEKMERQMGRIAAAQDTDVI